MRYFQFLVAFGLSLSISALAAAEGPKLAVVKLTAANTVISQSCRVVIPPGTVIEDTGGKGVIQIGAPNIEIEFAEGSVLRGSPAGTRPDQYKGYGIRLNGHAGVTIRGARVSGFWCGLWATKADGLVARRHRRFRQPAGLPEVHDHGRGWRRLAVRAQQRPEGVAHAIRRGHLYRAVRRRDGPRFARLARPERACAWTASRGRGSTTMISRSTPAGASPCGGAHGTSSAATPSTSASAATAMASTTAGRTRPGSSCSSRTTRTSLPRIP